MTTVAVVTGGGGAMGAACGVALAPTVDLVLLADVDEGRLEAAAEHVGATSTATVCTLAGDLGDPAGVDALAERARGLGTLRSLVHTAGLSPSMAGWQEVLRVDLVATARLLDAFVGLAAAGSVAVCVASMAAHLGAFAPEEDALVDRPLDADLEERFAALVGDDPDPGVTYRLAKRGVVRLCEREAAAWGARGGRVVSVSPGLVDTGMGRLELEHHPIKQWMAEHTPVGGGRAGGSALPGLIEDVADAVAFLCSERAAFVSGCDLRVDGGLTASMNHPAPAGSTDGDRGA